GTILIEAAMIAKNIAPGKNRKFASEQWSIIPQEIWKTARKSLADLEKKNVKPKIFGSDIDSRALELAGENIKIAGVEDILSLQKLALKDISSDYDNGVIVCNPPYGERISEVKEAEDLYREMGKVFVSRFPQWSYFIITPNTNFEKLFGKKANKNRKLYNGGIKCYFYQYYGKRQRIANS
ncbi:class I SAM-dependent RNA methyltransferase, partial [bacterium]|nr:class I SAM-dependent RNA methyltransferase [bacterium]